MKQKILGLFMSFAGLLMSASIVHAGQPTITATHTIVSESIAADGTTTTTLNTTINNKGLDSLYNVSFDFTSSLIPPDTPKSTLLVGNIAAGSTITSTWIVSAPAKVIFPSAPIMMSGSGNDVLGNPVAFIVFSN